MKSYKMFFVAWLIPFSALAQNTITITLKDSETAEPLIGATVAINDLGKITSTDSKGQVIFTGISDGAHSFEYRYVGYIPKRDTLIFPMPESQPVADIKLRVPVDFIFKRKLAG